jgi:hypothetical protein
MKTGGIIALVVGVIVVLYFAVSRGLISSGVSVGPGGQVKGIVAPQPSASYGGYLAATSAPAVSGILNTTLAGLNHAFAGWFGSGPSQPAAAPAALASTGPAPTLGAYVTTPNASAPLPVIGPQIADATAYTGLSDQFATVADENSYDPNTSLSFGV